jgi:hypothetical protein
MIYVSQCEDVGSGIFSVSDWSFTRRSKVMRKGRNTAEIISSDDEFDPMALSESAGMERRLILKATPRSRKGELMAKGAKEIRCICCHQVKSLAGAEESGDGWICEDCVPEVVQEENILPGDRTQLFRDHVKR